MVGSGVCWQDSAQLLHSICAVGTVVEAADSGSSTSASLLSGVSSCPLPVCVVGLEQLLWACFLPFNSTFSWLYLSLYFCFFCDLQSWFWSLGLLIAEAEERGQVRSGKAISGLSATRSIITCILVGA